MWLRTCTKTKTLYFHTPSFSLWKLIQWKSWLSPAAKCIADTCEYLKMFKKYFSTLNFVNFQPMFAWNCMYTFMWKCVIKCTWRSRESLNQCFTFNVYFLFDINTLYSPKDAHILSIACLLLYVSLLLFNSEILLLNNCDRSDLEKMNIVTFTCNNIREMVIFWVETQYQNSQVYT